MSGTKLVELDFQTLPLEPKAFKKHSPEKNGHTSRKLWHAWGFSPLFGTMYGRFFLGGFLFLVVAYISSICPHCRLFQWKPFGNPAAGWYVTCGTSIQFPLSLSHAFTRTVWQKFSINVRQWCKCHLESLAQNVTTDMAVKCCFCSNHNQFLW